jgi:hypothetical protein
MDETRPQRPGSNSAAVILPSRADLAGAIERVRIYERTALAPDQLAGLILAELDAAAAEVQAADRQAQVVRQARAIGTGHGTNAGRAAAEKGDRPDANSPPSVFADDPDYTLARLAADLGLTEDDPMLDAAADAYVVAAAAAFWRRCEEGASEDYPPTCILTGAPGENPDDCTTHDHEGDGRR